MGVDIAERGGKDLREGAAAPRYVLRALRNPLTIHDASFDQPSIARRRYETSPIVRIPITLSPAICP